MRQKDRVLLDACVLVGFPLADTLLRCAEEPAIYFPLWSDRILGEVQKALSGKLRLGPEKAERRITAMKQVFPEASVAGFAPLEPVLTEINLEDRHVLAAAIRGGAGRLLTLNTRHFPASVTARFEIDVVSPADLLLEWSSQDMDLFMDKIQQQAQDIREDVDSILKRLEKQGAIDERFMMHLAIHKMGG